MSPKVEIGKFFAARRKGVFSRWRMKPKYKSPLGFFFLVFACHVRELFMRLSLRAFPKTFVVISCV